MKTRGRSALAGRMTIDGRRDCAGARRRRSRPVRPHSPDGAPDVDAPAERLRSSLYRCWHRLVRPAVMVYFSLRGLELHLDFHHNHNNLLRECGRI